MNARRINAELHVISSKYLFKNFNEKIYFKDI